MRNDKLLAQKKFLEKKLMFKYLHHIRGPGVFALINERDKRILIKSSRNLTKSLFETVSNLESYSKTLYKDKKKLSVKILETNSEDIEFIGFLKLKYIAEYTAKGYTLYNKEKLPSYKPNISIMKDHETKFDLKVKVEIITGGRRTYFVKAFKTMSEATEFVANNTVFDMMKNIRNLKIERKKEIN